MTTPALAPDQPQSANVTLAIVQANSPTTTYPGDGNRVATQTITGLNASGSYQFSLWMQWDSTSKLLGGAYDSFNLYPTATGSAGPQTSTNTLSIASMANLGFELAVTSSVAGAATFYLSEFAIEAV